VLSVAKRIISRPMRFAVLSTSYHPAIAASICGAAENHPKKAAMQAAFFNNCCTVYLKV
jgi:hypothetical protein